MASPSSAEVTQLLQRWRRGEDAALEQLIPLVHRELHRRAQRYMSQERPEHTLQATALVNEAYLRLIDSRGVRWNSRAHFLAVAAQQMRRILVDHGRERNRGKRWGTKQKVSLDVALVVGPTKDTDVLALDDALEALRKIDKRKCQVVEMRFFGGMSAKETAEVLKVSEDTVLRDWRLARVWLVREILNGNQNETGTCQ